MWQSDMRSVVLYINGCLFVLPMHRVKALRMLRARLHLISWLRQMG